ncbi:MAG: alkaline phosphatase PafA [Chitinophagales bacterium]|nr:alkaline phosphatase family protein [Bacteroidota bacterium]MCB9042198.1 alkaline phosphatase family protein [Chitinophagales bacterium]
MKKILLLSFLLTQIVNAQIDRPKLVVGIVVDQMRNEYLYRFNDDFGKDGFKRLMKNGFVYNNMQFNYMPTYTGPGHSSVYTGTTPMYHGIVGNDFIVKQGYREMYCAQDDSVHVLGVAAVPTEGAMSPKNLLTTTVTDELKLATNFEGKVIGMSIKDRGAILPAGHFADFAYWLSDSGNFISSSFYGDALPEWVDNFNAQKHYETYLKKGWQLLKDAGEYNESLTDSNPYEAKIFGVLDPIFPYNLWQGYETIGARLIKVTPYGNDILLDFAKETIEHEQLGQDDVTDFLAISFSSTDYIGHAMGARSMEIQDTYLRLDNNMADLLHFLDKKVGKGQYVVFLTADHACAENPQFLHDHKYEVSSVSFLAMKQQLMDFSVENFGENFIKYYENQNIYFDFEKIDSAGLDAATVMQGVKTFLEEDAAIRRVYTQEEILNPSVVDPLLQAISRGYNTKLSGELVILYEPGYMEYGSTGTTHGTPYGYDTGVPALFYGWHIPKGNSAEAHYITEIAPTIAQLLHIMNPSGSEGKVLKEIVR